MRQIISIVRRYAINPINAFIDKNERTYRLIVIASLIYLFVVNAGVC